MKRCGGRTVTEERSECKRACEAIKAHYAEGAPDDVETWKRLEEFYHKRFGGGGHDHTHEEHEDTTKSEAHQHYQGEIPSIIESLTSGQVVLDLGSGHGFDAFLAQKKVGPTGRVIGVDMTPAMIHRSRKNAAEMELTNVEFRLGEIEHLPIEDASIDVVISNKVIHGLPEKNKAGVFREIFRVLKPGGGKFMMADILSTIEVDQTVIREAMEKGCQMIINPTLVADLQKYLTDAGFEDILIRPKDDSKKFITKRSEGSSSDDFVLVSYVEAKKP